MTEIASAIGGPSRRVRQSLVITLVAVGLYLFIRSLPAAGDHLDYTDFQAHGADIKDFCEPGSASFVPVEAVRSPVTLTLNPDGSLQAGAPVLIRARLEAASGRPLKAEDLLVVHTRKLHLLVSDPSLADYQHLHPVETEVPGEFLFSFTPRLTGRYQVYADFMPRATGRGLYAGSSIEVAGEASAPSPMASLATVAGEVHFRLSSSSQPVRINETVTLTLNMVGVDGSAPHLETIMDAYAHMVAFDFARQGFAHLHPRELDPVPGEGASLELSFLLNLPDPGWFRVWAQVLIAGEEVFAPFTLEVLP